MPDPDRREALADAAITTLAREGIRALTHRAVDRTAGLPEGTTSFYFRTRQSLLEATVARLAELDLMTVVDLPDTSLVAFADAFAELVADVLDRAGERQVARYELTLEALRRPELRDVLATPNTRIREVVSHRFSALGVAGADARAGDFLLLIDGLLFDRLIAPWSRTLTAAELRDLIGRILSAVATPAGLAGDEHSGGASEDAART